MSKIKNPKHSSTFTSLINSGLTGLERWDCNILNWWVIGDSNSGHPD